MIPENDNNTALENLKTVMKVNSTAKGVLHNVFDKYRGFTHTWSDPNVAKPRLIDLICQFADMYRQSQLALYCFELGTMFEPHKHLFHVDEYGECYIKVIYPEYNDIFIKVLLREGKPSSDVWGHANILYIRPNKLPYISYMDVPVVDHTEPVRYNYRDRNFEVKCIVDYADTVVVNYTPLSTVEWK